MDEQELTPWFDGDATPTKVGVYEKDIANIGHRFSNWNGTYWEEWSGSPDAAVNDFYWPRVKSEDQKAPWRGLAVKPE